MAVKELNEIYGEVGRNLDNQMDENVLIPGETGTKTFGAFKFFSGIKKFLEGSAKKIIKGGASVEGGLSVDSLTVNGRRALTGYDITIATIEIGDGNELTFEKDTVHGTGLYVARFTYDFGKLIDLGKYRMITVPSITVAYTNSNAPNLFLLTNAYNPSNDTGAYVFSVNGISARVWLNATFVKVKD